MKRHCLIIAAVFSMALTLTACGGNTDEDNLNGTTDTQTQNQEERREDVQEENPTNIQENEADSPQNDEPVEDDTETIRNSEEGEQTEMKMNVQIGDYHFTATLEENEAVKELVDMMKEEPVTISMSDYSGFEKVGSLGRSLTRNDSQTTTKAGDIVLYNGNNIVMFYGSNSWSYTRIGKIDDLSDWETALGSGSITAIFTVAEN